MEHMVHCVVKDLPISDIKLSQLQQVTKEDQDMQILSKYIKEGWPQNKPNVPVQVRPFWNVRHELHLLDGLVMKGHCLVIPLSWRPSVLQQIHSGHFGIEKSKARARAAVYWPGLSVDISDMISKCDKCSSLQRKQQKEPMLPREISLFPWQHIDIAVKVGPI